MQNILTNKKKIVYLYITNFLRDEHKGSNKKIKDLLILLPDSYEGKEFTKQHGNISDRLYYLSLELGVDISPLIILKKYFMHEKHPLPSTY